MSSPYASIRSPSCIEPADSTANSNLRIYRSKANVNKGMADGQITMEQYFQGAGKYEVNDNYEMMQNQPANLVSKRNATIVVRQQSGKSGLSSVLVAA